jgi:hypothetical protein
MLARRFEVAEDERLTIRKVAAEQLIRHLADEIDPGETGP